MSVLKNKRTTSKAEFVNTANHIYTETMQFLTRLSARYARLMAENVVRLASEVVEHSEKANSIYPSDEARRALRETHLLEARASLMALDVQMAHVYELCMLNPQGCFTRANGQTEKAADAVAKLDKMAQSLGEKIDEEDGLLKAVLKSDRGRTK